MKYIEIEANRLCKILEDELAEIRYVKHWAAKAGCSKRNLQRVIKTCYGITAKAKLKEIRFNAIKQTLREHPGITSYGLAATVGLKNEQGVYNFLSRNFDTSFSNIKLLVISQKKMGGGNSDS